MAKKPNLELERVSINLPSSIVAKVKEYADNLGINYTSAYIILLNQALEQKAMLAELPMMINMMSELKQLQANAIIDEEDEL